jgi:hypothetical protein
MFVYIEVQYSTKDKSPKNFVIKYPVISDCIRKSFSKEKIFKRELLTIVFLVNSFNGTVLKQLAAA